MPRLHERQVQAFLKPYQRRNKVIQPFVLAGAILVGVIGLYLLLNASALNRIRPIVFSPSPSQAVVIQPASPSNTINPEIIATPPPSTVPADLPNNTLVLATLNISAPVIWDVNFYDQSVYQQLQSGVIQFAGTPKPGQQGMVVIFGHSSYYPWAKGSYKTIFAPLVKAQIGQTIQLVFDNQMYKYQVSKSYEIQPDQVEILNSSSNLSGVRLITCTPIGTSLRRLVIEAEQISPDPSTNTGYTQEHFTGLLPTDQ